MTKSAIVCPFSKAACRECGVYRGRHIEFCIHPKYRLGGRRSDKPRGLTNEVATGWDSPELAEFPAVLADIEDSYDEYLERRGR